MKLSYRIFLYFGTFILLIIVFFFIINYFVIQRTLYENGQRDLRHLVISTSTAVENMLNIAIRNYLRGVVEQDIALLKTLHGKVNAGILTEQQAKDEFQKHVLNQTIGKNGYIVALRPQGAGIILDIHPFLRGKNCASNQGCQDWVLQKNGYSEYEWQNPEDKQMRKKVGYIMYFEPWDWVVGATSYKDEFTQLVKTDDLKGFISSYTILEKGYFILFDASLTFLIHPELKGKSGQDLQNVDGKYVVREVISNPEKFHYYRWKNPSQKIIKEKFAYAAKLEDFNWYLVATGYMEDLTLPIDKLMRISYLLIIIVAMLLISLTLFFSRTLSRPLDELSQGLNDFYRGKKIFRMKSRTVAEVEAVGHAIEKMTKALVDSEQEKKEMEAVLLQSRKMEAIGTLAGGIAHDFNNILSGILGYAQLAVMHLKNPEKAEENLNHVIRGGQKAADLVQQILTYSRQSTNEKLTLKLSVVVKETLKLLRASIPSSIDIKTELLSDDTVRADPTQLHQVIMNLCTNAYHAMMSGGGTMAVTLNEVQIAHPEIIPGLSISPGKYLRLGVSDTGPGMAPDIQEKIFDPYFTTKTAEKGTGLGLSLVAGIVNEHNGYIKTYSEPGMGTTFHIFLPVIREKANADTQSDVKEIIKGGRESIMIVDDEKDILFSMKGLLENFGYQITIFEDGMAALEAYEQNADRFDLVITDMTMPRMTGWDLARQILRNRPEQKIIVCTGYSELINREKAHSIGISGYYEKPVIIDELAKTIRDVLDETK